MIIYCFCLRVYIVLVFLQRMMKQFVQESAYLLLVTAVVWLEYFEGPFLVHLLQLLCLYYYLLHSTSMLLLHWISYLYLPQFYWYVDCKVCKLLILHNIWWRCTSLRDHLASLSLLLVLEHMQCSQILKGTPRQFFSTPCFLWCHVLDTFCWTTID